MSFLAEFFGFLRARRKLWLVPGLLMMLVLGALAVFTKGSIVAPFIYTIF